MRSGDLVVEVFQTPFVHGVEKLFDDCNGGLPLVKVVDLDRLTGTLVEDDVDVVRVDVFGSPGVGLLVGHRAQIREVDLDRFPCACDFGFDVEINAIEECEL